MLDNDKNSQNISDDPNGPAVHCFTVRLLRQNLRSWNNEMFYWSEILSAGEKRLGFWIKLVNLDFI